MGLAIAAVALPLFGSASDPVLTLTGDRYESGFIHLVAVSDPVVEDLRIVELKDGVDVPIAGAAAEPDGSVVVDAHWTCVRERWFQAIDAAGHRSEVYAAWTPPCERRLRVQTAEHVRRGRNIRITLRDRWRVGDTSAELCVEPPGERATCETAVIPAGQLETSRIDPAMVRGPWTIRVKTPFQSIVRHVRVVGQAHRGSKPTFLTTGDSMMLALNHALENRLRTTARVVDDIYISSGISRPFIVDWATLPAKQVKARHPDVTVMTLGMQDGAEFTTANGTVACCNEEWIGEYADRARAVMETYTRNGRARVIWLNVPYPEDRRRASAVTAVNDALDQAWVGVAGATVIDLAAILTPNDVFQREIERDGRMVTVREPDGIHLSKAGARIAARAVVAALAR
jgi:lysophospholipase L1-like esterase